MGRDRFVIPNIVRLDISEGDWIDVKGELDAGDQRKQDALALVPTVVTVDGKERVLDRVDWSQYELMRTHLWLIDWSLTKTNKEGKIVSIPVSMESLRSLEIETFNEINEAIYGHILKVIELKKTRKKTHQPKEDVALIST